MLDPVCVCGGGYECVCSRVSLCLHAHMCVCGYDVYVCVCVLNCHCLPACIPPAGILIVLQISPISIYNYSS